eukprot:TRINITY_DN2395_c1_g2_i2.p1 TRINITY_DN2395_c1_g2~~TRINITY_DN2395_c1_g2_i2.p1  ORF type:complete len:460 (+),score=159.22 TRINITY_DN2395_c1_g2_i2:774-2153(+)
MRVLFCAYDLSTIDPPCDVRPDSAQHVEAVASLLMAVRRESMALCRAMGHGGFTSRELPMLALLRGLATVARAAGAGSAAAAGKAVLPLEQSGPLKTEVEQACRDMGTATCARYAGGCATLLLAEISCLHMQVSAGGAPGDAQPQLSGPGVSSESFLRRRLLEILSSALRFHLRRLLNAPPQSPTAATDMERAGVALRGAAGSSAAAVRSAVWQLVRLVRAADGAADESALSSVLTQALAMLWHAQRGAAQRGVAAAEAFLQQRGGGATAAAAQVRGAKAARSARVTKAGGGARSEYEAALAHLEHVSAAQGAAAASTFVLSLMDWPGAAEAIALAGGWGPVETLASQLADVCGGETAGAAGSSSSGGGGDTGHGPVHLCMLRDINALTVELRGGEAEMAGVAARAAQAAAQLQALVLQRASGAGEPVARVRELLEDIKAGAALPQLAPPSQTEAAGQS